MESKVKVDAGICGFKTVIKASSEDGMNVELKVVSSCDTIKELASRFKDDVLLLHPEPFVEPAPGNGRF